MAQITDNFNRTAETPLSNGGVWSVGVGGYQDINTDGAQAQAAVQNDRFNVARADTPSIGADQYAQIVLTNAGIAGGGGPCVRQQASTNQAMYGLQVLIDDVFWSSVRQLLIFDSGGGETQIASTSDTAASGTTLRLEVSGTTLTAKKNGAAFSPALTAVDATLGSGQPGFMLARRTATASDIEADDFDAGDLGASGPTAAQMAGIFSESLSGGVIGRVDA